MLFPSTLLLLSAVAVPGVAAADATCYNIAGQPVAGWKACSSSSASASADAPSFCCGSGDYCLDNGLCLDAGFYWGRRAGVAAAAAAESTVYERPAPKSVLMPGELPGYSPASAHGVFPPAQELAS